MANYETICPGCFEDKGHSSRCPSCGFKETKRNIEFFLPYRTLLNGQYLTGKELGDGGFGITYLALDIALRCPVAIKEFFPRDLVAREAGGTTLFPFSKETEEFYLFGLDRFLLEAQTMAKFNHPNIVRVRTVFPGNNTAYIVMDYYRGQSIEQLVKAGGGRLSQGEALDIMLPITEGLKTVHKEKFLHRDIKPQNILVTLEGNPILIDFGAARYITGQRSQNLTIVLTPGFAPFEQYQSRGEQGTWTDIYSFSATLYFMLSGKVPPFAPERAEDDTLEPLEDISPDLSPNVCNAVMKGLELRKENRPQTIAEFLELLNPETPDPPKSFIIKCLSGDYQGSSIEVTDEQIIIGRDPEKVNLFISNSEISRVHTQVWLDQSDRGVWIADCNSLNGTYLFVGGPGDEESQWKKIQKEQLLKPGDRFRVGLEGNEFEVDVEWTAKKEPEEKEKTSIVRCPSCGITNEILLIGPLEDASCSNCGASLGLLSKKTAEYPESEIEPEEAVYAETKRKSAKGWLIFIFIVIIAAIVAYFLLRP